MGIDDQQTGGHMSTQEATIRQATLTPDRIMQLGFGYWGSRTLLSAVELGLFTELAKGPQDAESLWQRLRIHPRSAGDFFDALVALGMLERRDGQESDT